MKDQIREIVEATHLPRATYRLQFNPDFTFKDAQALVDYLDDLGISDLYASPLFKPRSNSTHGYDVVDYNQLNPTLGTPEDFDALASALRDRDMGILLDIVPNHMGVNTENEWWMDILKHGPSSVYGHYFDIDWRPQNRALDDRVLLPVLSDHYGRVLEAGKIELVYWHGDFYLHYYDHQFPVTPETYAGILQRVHEELIEIPADETVEQELLSIITATEHLPPYTATHRAALTVRRREQQVIRRRLLALFDGSKAFREAMHRALHVFNGDPDEPASFDELDALLSRQPYRLSYWRVAFDEINYRRFFDINDMAAIRIEDPEVFADTHRLTLRLLAEDKVTGLRIDHPDGLWNPEAYFMRLQEEYVLAKIKLDDVDKESVTAWLAEMARSDDRPAHWPLYALVEKILSETEPLPYSWAVYGTTGYDFLNAVNNLFVNPDHETTFDALYQNFTGRPQTFEEITDQTKKLIMAETLTSEIDARSAELARIVEQNRRYRGFTQNSLAFGMREIVTGLSIYRTYITDPSSVTERDRHYITEAVELAKARNRLTPSSIFDFLLNTLLMRNLDDFPESQRGALRAFVMKFQQFTGPVMAKSVEDTAFYIYNRLLSLNEVGGHPAQFGTEEADFHRHNTTQTFCYTMLSTSTHDTKRSEDVRARINVLSEIPDEWEHAIQHWAEINEPGKTVVNGAPAPSRNDEYLLYQTLVGAWPDELESFRERLITYLHKAINEAKEHSNWINPNEAYAEAVEAFANYILDNEAFRSAFEPFGQRVAFYGRFNSLAQVLLKLTAPGVPDIYQGNEMWRFSLADPDNRRPVDFEHQRSVLAGLKERAAEDPHKLASALIEEAQTGAVKLYLIYRALNYRRAHKDLFQDGTYRPIKATGAKAKHICAFVRQSGGAAALVVAPRLVVGLTGGKEIVPVGREVWEDTYLELPGGLGAGSVENAFTGESLASPGEKLAVADILTVFPVGLFDLRLPK